VSTSENPVSRITRGVSAVTSKIFRCGGLHTQDSDCDPLSGYDLGYWLLFIGVIAGWFLFIFAPQRQRMSLLQDRLETLATHLKEDNREIKRIKRSIQELNQGDPYAWERTARGRLGWLEPGETVDPLLIAALNVLPPRSRTEDGRRRRIPNLPRPAIPPIPQAPVPAARFAFFDRIGPLQSCPPPLPRRPEPIAEVVQINVRRSRTPAVLRYR